MQLRAFRGELLRLAHARGEPVALALELGEAEQARAGQGVEELRGGGRRRRDVREARGDDRRELALELRDLRAQRTACGALPCCAPLLDARLAALDR